MNRSADRTEREAARVERLRAIAARIEGTGRDDLDGLEDRLGGWPDFSAGAWRVQMHGVAGTSAVSRGDALRAWARAARRRADRLRGA